MFENEKIFILGMARSGYQAAKFLCKRNCDITVYDQKDESKLNIEQVNELRSLGVHLFLGEDETSCLDASFSYFIKSPGVFPSNSFVMKAMELKIPVINEVEMAFLLLPKDVNIVAITGTNGKTTTTSLIYDIVKRAYSSRTHLAGNIGYPLISIIDTIKENDILIMEISCQQLASLDKFHPHIAVMTNLSPAHIDMFGSYEIYKDVKAKLFKEQTSDDIAILNMENNDVLDKTKNIKSIAKYFSSKNEINGCYLKDNWIYYYMEKIVSCEDILIVGIHNVENVMASIMVSKELGISNEIIKDVIINFKGVEHRLEFVDKINGVSYYNDTEATNIKSTQIALSSFNNPIILILGGLERNQDFNELTAYLSKVKLILAIGECRNRIKDFGDKLNIETYACEFLKDIFPLIKDKAKENDVVLLSPSSASWDQYKQCEDRGQEFKERVAMLKNED